MSNYPILKAGDRILSRRITGAVQFFSMGLAWFLHSHYSHVVPVISQERCIDILYPKPKPVHSSVFMCPDYTIKILRPKFQLSVEQIDMWTFVANGLLNYCYDLESFEGFLLDNADIQDPKKVNCAEGTLICDKSIGLLTEYNGHLVSPQTYEDFSHAGLFDVIYSDELPST